jgi:8-oxo-dGTP pyrophosphatase MutT (NUDIX family)
MFSPFIQQLKYQLQQPLPGEDIQHQMSPIGRPKLKDFSNKEYNPKKSAVLILLFPHEQTIESTLIVRPLYDGVHSGQVAFPGGKYEEGDVHLQHTALRETHEEIGVAPHNIEIIGSLTEVYISPSNFLVTPFVGFTPKKPQFNPSPKEVDKIVTYDIINFGKTAIKTEKPIKLSMGFEIIAPCYEIEDITVWGATAMMISEFDNIIEEIKRTTI